MDGRGVIPETDIATGSTVHEALLVYSDGVSDHADAEHLGYHATSAKAEAAISAALKGRPAGWRGVLREGTYMREGDVTGFLDPAYRDGEPVERTIEGA